MTLVTLDQPISYGPIYPLGDQYPSSSPRLNALDGASSQKHYYSLQFPKSGDIEEISIYIGAVTTSQDFRVSLQTIGTDGMPTGTPITNGNSDALTPTADSWNTFTWTTEPTVVAGQFYAYVLEWVSTAGSVSVKNFSASNSWPYLYRYTGTIWSAMDGYAMCRLRVKYSDGSYPNFHGQIAPWWGDNDYFVRSATYPAAGIKFKVPFPCRLCGLGGVIDWNNVDLNPAIILWGASDAPSAGTELLQVGDQGSGEDDLAQSAGGAHSAAVMFKTKPTLVKDTWYRLGMYNSKSSGPSLYSVEAPSVAAMEQLGAIDMHVTCSTDGTNWIDRTDEVMTLLMLIDQIDNGVGGGGGGGSWGGLG